MKSPPLIAVEARGKGWRELALEWTVARGRRSTGRAHLLGPWTRLLGSALGFEPQRCAQEWSSGFPGISYSPVQIASLQREDKRRCLQSPVGHFQWLLQLPSSWTACLLSGFSMRGCPESDFPVFPYTGDFYQWKNSGFRNTWFEFGAYSFQVADRVNYFAGMSVSIWKMGLIVVVNVECLKGSSILVGRQMLAPVSHLLGVPPKLHPFLSIWAAFSRLPPPPCHPLSRRVSIIHQLNNNWSQPVCQNPC